MRPFNVLLFEFNKNKPTYYDIMPYLISQYEKLSKRKKSNFHTFEDYKKFIQTELQYQYWSRCEYEFLISHWPQRDLKDVYKIDVYEQCMMNIDTITEVFISNIKS